MRKPLKIQIIDEEDHDEAIKEALKIKLSMKKIMMKPLKRMHLT